MILRLAEDRRANGRVHLIEQNSFTTLCGRDANDFTSRQLEKGVPDCRSCADAAARLRKEQAS